MAMSSAVPRAGSKEAFSTSHGLGLGLRWLDGTRIDFHYKKLDLLAKYLL
jgi:hypothetical protein